MILADIPAGAAVFADANILLFAVTNEAAHGPSCEAFLDRAENQEVTVVASTYTLGEVLHRLMTIEAGERFGWPNQGIANRLRRHPAEVQQLVRPRQALDEIIAARVSVVPVALAHVSAATDVSRQTGLLYGDALVVAVMRDLGLIHLASLDADFDRVPGLTRYAPA
jgi:predicted nucleic acid-binding protein